MKWAKNNNRKYTDEEQKTAREMVKANKVEEMTLEELEAALEYADEMDFYAEMSDDWGVTRREQAQTWEWAHVVKEERDRKAA